MASLTDFAATIQSESLVEMVKEADMNGVEEVMIRLIEIDNDKNDKVKAVASREDIRDAQRIREIKHLEKSIKIVHKMMAAATANKPEEEVKEKFNGQLSFTATKSIVSQKPNKFSSKQEGHADMLSGLLGKQQKSNLEKLLEHSSSTQKRQKYE